MNCDLAWRLIDDYLRGELGHRDRNLLEKHVARCARCAAELRRRPAFERDLRRALASSVHPIVLSPDAGARMVQAAEQSLQRGIRSQRISVTFRWVASTVVALLLVVGLFSLAERLPMPHPFNRLALFPENRLLFSDADPTALSAAEQPADQYVAASSGGKPRVTLLFSPQNLRPSGPYTMTVFLENETPHALESVRFDLDISGPTGSYRFGWVVQGPVAAHDASAVRLTTDLLALPCEEQYQIAPSDLFGQAGVYTLRLTLLESVVASQ